MILTSYFHITTRWKPLITYPSTSEGEGKERSREEFGGIVSMAATLVSFGVLEVMKERYGWRDDTGWDHCVKIEMWLLCLSFNILGLEEAAISTPSLLLPLSPLLASVLSWPVIHHCSIHHPQSIPTPRSTSPYHLSNPRNYPANT